MALKRDEFYPYTIPYSGTGAVAVDHSSFVSSSRASEVSINTKELSTTRSPAPSIAGFQRPGGTSFYDAPAVARTTSTPSSGYIYSGCNGDSCESATDHINPYSPNYLQDGHFDSQPPSHLDPPFVRQSHMPSDYVAMPTGDSRGIFHMMQAEADRVNEEVNECALVAAIRSKNPPRPSDAAFSSAMHILHGPGYMVSDACSRDKSSDQITLADRKTESTSTPRALDLATTRKVGHTSNLTRDTGDIRVRYQSPNRPRRLSSQSASQSSSPQQVTLPVSFESGQSDNPLYNCVSLPDLTKLPNGHVECRCGGSHDASFITTKTSMVADLSQETHILSECTASSAPKAYSITREENINPGAPTEPEDDPWVIDRN